MIIKFGTYKENDWIKPFRQNSIIQPAQTNQNIKLLVHLHLYYLSQIDFMLDKLANIDGCDWDLVVTMVENNPTVQKN